MEKILLATRNKNKLKEIKEILNKTPFEFLSLDEVKDKIPLDFKIREKGKNFKENALLKAKTCAQKTGLLALADDSGLRVDFLNGAPGVKSRRFGRGSDKSRCQKLLKALAGVSREKRKARFICVVCLYNPQNSRSFFAQGECLGEIAFREKGRFGFGYDPVFIVKGLNKHFAQLTLKEKNQISHRAKALRKLKALLLKNKI